MKKLILSFYQMECGIFKSINQYFDNRILNVFFRTITHLGGARFTIGIVLVMAILFSDSLRLASIASMIALAVSHLPVHFIKKIYPRKRPYIRLKNARFPVNPLVDHSFPSGHTTAIFSIVLPYTLYFPDIFVPLLAVALSVGFSRIYLGLHYPTDVLAGAILGTSCGILSFYALAA